jgi:hypothetical protein
MLLPALSPSETPGPPCPAPLSPADWKSFMLDCVLPAIPDFTWSAATDGTVDRDGYAIVVVKVRPFLQQLGAVFMPVGCSGMQGELGGLPFTHAGCRAWHGGSKPSPSASLRRQSFPLCFPEETVRLGISSASGPCLARGHHGMLSPHACRVPPLRTFRP